MSAIARNAPCPCGASAKYKRCCLPRVEAARRAQRVDDRVGHAIRAWVEAEHPSALRRVLAPVELDRLGGGFWWDQQFVTWALNDALPDDGGPPLGARYAGCAGLDSDERDVAARIAGARLGVHRVIEAVPGAWIRLAPLLGGEPARVMSESVSMGVEAGRVLLGRVMDGPPAPSLWGPARLFGSETGRRWRAYLAELPPLAAADPTTGLALLRFEPEDYAEPLPEGPALAEIIFDVADDGLVLEELESMPQARELGREIGAGDDAWAFAWVLPTGEDVVDLRGLPSGVAGIEAARIVVKRDRLTVHAAGAALLADIAENLERGLAGLVTPHAQQRLQAA